jgi:hypothetical protein
MNWYYFINKKVEIELFSQIVRGTVIDVDEWEICKQIDPLTHQCICSDKYNVMFLIAEDGTFKTINCNAITDIKELK